LSFFWQNQKVRRKIETQLRGGGGKHEMLMVAMAPKWKQWGVDHYNIDDQECVISESEKIPI